MIPYERFLLETVRTDKRVVILTAENRGHMRNIPPLLGSRFVDVGIAEQTMIGVAAGLASRGRVVFTHALAAFLTLRAFEFIRDDVGISSLPVIMVGMVPGVLSDANGPTHQAIEDVAIMRGIPNVHVFCPADEDDMIIGLPHIVRSGKPTYVRYTNLPSAVGHSNTFALGVAEIVSDIDPEVATVTILTYGTLVRQAVHAAALLASEGVSVCVVNMRMLSPVDEAMILRATRNSRLVVTLEDHFRAGGLATIVAETLMNHAEVADVLPIALNTWFTPGLLADVLDNEKLRGDHVAETIQGRLQTLPLHHAEAVHA